MASPLDALNYAKRLTGNMPVDDAALKLRILNAAHNKLWMSAPWRWTVGAVDVVTLANGTQDYSVTALTDLLFLVQSKRTNGQETTDLNIAATLPLTTAITGQPSQVTMVDTDTLRVFPQPAGYTTFPKVVSIYKKTPIAITEANDESDYDTVYGVPAAWFWVFEEIVVLKAYQFSHNARVGSVTTVDGKVQYTGQMGVVEAAIMDMREAEKKFLDSIGQAVQNG